ncbi:MAG: hypothetical protein JO283_07015 [Bradyrhizobium sp.]|nr:hypothetical protein [Bradyrhizobium sp.]
MAVTISAISIMGKQAIACAMPGEPRRDEVAIELCMSERTLQRRSGKDSFIQLLDDTRHELADQYLGRMMMVDQHVQVQAIGPDVGETNAQEAVSSAPCR